MYNLWQVIRSVNSSVDRWPGMMYLWTAFHGLAMSHACYNPIILCWMNNKFRSGFCYVAYHLPCLRKCLDSCFTNTHEENILRATAITSAHGTRLSSRLIVTISLKDDSIVFKSRHCNGKTIEEEVQGPNKFLTTMEESSSDSKLWYEANEENRGVGTSGCSRTYSGRVCSYCSRRVNVSTTIAHHNKHQCCDTCKKKLRTAKNILKAQKESLGTIEWLPLGVMNT